MTTSKFPPEDLELTQPGAARNLTARLDSKETEGEAQEILEASQHGDSAVALEGQVQTPWDRWDGTRKAPLAGRPRAWPRVAPAFARQGAGTANALQPGQGLRLNS